MEYLERRSRWKRSLKGGAAYEDDLTTPAHALTPGAEEEFKEVCTFEWKQLNFIYLLLLLSGGREKRQESGQEPGSLKDERGQAGYVSPSWILCLRSRGEPGRAGYASLVWSGRRHTWLEAPGLEISTGVGDISLGIQMQVVMPLSRKVVNWNAIPMRCDLWQKTIVTRFSCAVMITVWSVTRRLWRCHFFIFQARASDAAKSMLSNNITNYFGHFPIANIRIAGSKNITNYFGYFPIANKRSAGS